jgi:hypothetical protein
MSGDIRFTSTLVLVILILLVPLGKSARAANSIKYLGGNLPWLVDASGHSNTFGTNYNASEMHSYLTQFANNNLNFMRVFACVRLYSPDGGGTPTNTAATGLTFTKSPATGSWICQGIAPSFTNNLVDFVSFAKSKGITVEFVFINFDDIRCFPSLITGYDAQQALIQNGLVPFCLAIKRYSNWQIDLINEADMAIGYKYKGDAVTWSNLGLFATDAKQAIVNAGINNWVTMSCCYTYYLTSHNGRNFSTSFGGHDFDFYEFHNYNSTGACTDGSGNPVPPALAHRQSQSK